MAVHSTLPKVFGSVFPFFDNHKKEVCFVFHIGFVHLACLDTLGMQFVLSSHVVRFFLCRFLIRPDAVVDDNL